MFGSWRGLANPFKKHKNWQKMDFVSQSLSVSCYFFQTVFFRTRPVRQRKTMRQSWSSTVEKHWLNSCWFLRLKKTSFIITWCNVVSEPDDLLSDDESSFRLLLYCMFLYRPLKARQCCNCWPMFQSDVQVSPDQDQLTWLPDIVQLSEAESWLADVSLSSRSWRQSWMNTGHPWLQANPASTSGRKHQGIYTFTAHFIRYTLLAPGWTPFLPSELP